MYKTWSISAGDLESLQHELDTFLNEFVEELISVSYAIQDRHYVLVVYRAVDLEVSRGAEAAVSAAEEIIEGVEVGRIDSEEMQA